MIGGKSIFKGGFTTSLVIVFVITKIISVQNGLINNIIGLAFGPAWLMFDSYYDHFTADFISECFSAVIVNFGVISVEITKRFIIFRKVLI